MASNKEKDPRIIRKTGANYNKYLTERKTTQHTGKMKTILLVGRA